MKETFKKIELLTHHSDRGLLTSQLQELGVIHLEVNDDFRNETIEVLERQKLRLTKAIQFLKSHAALNDSNETSVNSEKLEVEEAVDQILDIKQQLEINSKENEVLKKNKEKLKHWGDFDSEKISRLLEANIHFTFYIADEKEFNQYDFSEIIHEVIYRGPSQIYFVVLSHGKLPSIPFDKIQLPAMDKLEIASSEKNLSRKQEELDQNLGSFAKYLPLFSQELTKLENQLQLHLANGSYNEHGEGAILYIKGWFPATKESQLVKHLKQGNWSYLISDPVAGDAVPVLLKNPSYTGLFAPITKIFQLPSYYEMDLTPFIAVFYPILFAYCLGDAGYGLLLLGASIAGWFSFLKSSRNFAALGIILGLFTTVMGVVKSGSLFGIPLVSQDAHPVLEYLAQYVVIPDDRSVVFNAFNVALMIGVVQILVGIIVSIVNKIIYKGFMASISQIGKLLMVVSIIWLFLADMQDVEALQPFPLVRRGALVLGVLLVLFFHDLKVPVLKRAASGILPLFFIITGILGDVLSYVRLFALGVASSVLGLVVNQIGMQIMGESWWSILIGVVFLIFGHSLNLALATLGAFVHPLRLTFVEFYNNAQFEGGGVAYKPLRKINIDN